MLVTEKPSEQVPLTEHSDSSETWADADFADASAEPTVTRPNPSTAASEEKPLEPAPSSIEQLGSSLTSTSNELDQTSTPVINDVSQQWDIPTPVTHQAISQTIETQEYVQSKSTSTESLVVSSEPRE